MNSQILIDLATKTNDIINVYKGVFEESKKVEVEARLNEQRNKDLVKKQDDLAREKLKLSTDKESLRLERLNFTEEYQKFLTEKTLLTKQQEVLKNMKSAIDADVKKLEDDKIAFKKEKDEVGLLKLKIKSQLADVEKREALITKNNLIARERNKQQDQREKDLNLQEQKIQTLLG